MQVIFASSECFPFIKTGGLGDVVYALPRSLSKARVDVRVILPKSSLIPEQYSEQMNLVAETVVRVGWREQYCGIYQLDLDGVTYYFVDNEYYFKRNEGYYGYYDDGERFAFFSWAVAAVIEKLALEPAVIHLNDWHTAMVAPIIRHAYGWNRVMNNCKIVFTIHNLRFQGVFSESVLEDFFEFYPWDAVHAHCIWNEDANFMKAAIIYADRITTVSPNYAREIQTRAYGEGLDGILREHSGKLSGILNGIDTELYNPYKDVAIKAPYNAHRVNTQKPINKAALQEQFGLPVDPNIPLIGIVSRLDHQKGFDLVGESLHGILDLGVQLVLLGTGDPHIEHIFKHYAHAYKDQVACFIGFDDMLARQIYAGSDMFLMPSRFEPCGIGQMLAMRYGSIPIVRETGGLADTVPSYNPTDDSGKGFTFLLFEGHELVDAIARSTDIYYNNKVAWKKIISRAMRDDYSWANSAKNYIELYTGN